MARSQLLSLPIDVISVVLSCLPNEDKHSLRLTCKKARDVVDVLWKPLADERFGVIEIAPDRRYNAHYEAALRRGAPPERVTALVQGANVTELLAKARGDIRGSVAVVLRNNEADPVATAAFYDKLGREGLGVLKDIRWLTLKRVNVETLPLLLAGMRRHEASLELLVLEGPQPMIQHEYPVLYALAPFSALRVLRLVNVEIYAHWEFSRFVRVEMLQLVATLGDIPSDLWHMPSLRTLEMEALEGLEDLPADIPASAGLQRLVLRECYELGLPEKITNLRRLTELCVENGRFGGRLGEEGMDGLTSLETLKLVNALVEDSPLPRLDRMTNLRRIEYKDDSNERLLQRTDAVGPSDIGQLDGLTRLMSVDIGECLPQNLVFSTGAPLTRLCISNVYGAAQLPPSIANLGQLRELYLSNFTNINTWPANFSRLTSLTKLDILLCDIGNADNITLLTNLRSLSMDGDFFPNSIGQLTGLHSLELVSQAIGPDLPPDITRLTNLARLKLDVGCSSHFFPKLSYLRRLRECHLTYHDSYEQPADRAGEPDPLDTMFFEATSLTSLTLNVEDDRIGLYEPWTGHSNLRELEVGGRRFSNLRSYCDSTKRLTKLTRLAVPSPGNMEYASVPRLPNLRALEFTEMVGRLPAGISQLHDLQELKLSEKGTLCMQVTELRSLRRIGGGMKWAGDAEHVRAVAGLARMGVKLDLCR